MIPFCAQRYVGQGISGVSNKSRHVDCVLLRFRVNREGRVFSVEPLSSRLTLNLCVHNLLSIDKFMIQPRMFKKNYSLQKLRTVNIKTFFVSNQTCRRPSSVVTVLYLYPFSEMELQQSTFFFHTIRRKITQQKLFSMCTLWKLSSSSLTIVFPALNNNGIE